VAADIKVLSGKPQCNGLSDDVHRAVADSRPFMTVSARQCCSDSSAVAVGIAAIVNMAGKPVEQPTW